MNSAAKARPMSSCSIAPKWTRNQTPQPGRIARRMGIAGNDARPENRQPIEAYRLNRFFFQPHDAHVANPAFGVASHGREQRKMRDASGVTATGKAPTTPISSAFKSSSLHFTLPLPTPTQDAPQTGSPCATMLAQVR